MVRTRGLGLALGRIIGRALGREDCHDSSDAPQQRRPTASARRQRGVVLVAEDEPVLPADEPVVPVTDPVVAANEPMVDADVQDTGANTGVEAAADEPEGFLGGLRDASVLTEYADHVAASVWSGEERPELKLSSHGRKVQKVGRPIHAIKGLVASTRLSHLITCSVDTGDQELIFSFMERWHRETSSFHLPMGEVTITLDDVVSLLHLPVERQPGLRQDIAMDHTYAYLGYEIYSATHVHVVFLDTLQDLSQTGRYAWGAAALVHMYDHLNDACINSSRQLAGYATLLQCWIYKHFPSVAECIADPDYDEVSPHACRWISMKKTVKTISTKTYRQHLDRLRILDVCWMPYGEHRLVREFQLISCFFRQLR
ncbi:protein MAIN-LIKE 1-like [Glycine max]|uniref:protein MAIN-LIKE 1-like n=1 Tax=Glycine max TaxID=3847 RepID=UPI0003DEAB67|nr:protein MAIN-LIKE 1-like [Glycine max]|eukprot:XP_006606971.1 protein MAIN-LIKE 1-like [Glycine max]